jgi:hypothetical protein
MHPLSLLLYALGVIALIVGAVGLVFDLQGLGDWSMGWDPKDLAVLVVGILLVAAASSLRPVSPVPTAVVPA